MNKDQVKGTAKDIGGKIREEAGKLIGSSGQQAKGLKDQARGKLQKSVGDLKEAVKKESNLPAHKQEPICQAVVVNQQDAARASVWPFSAVRFCPGRDVECATPSPAATSSYLKEIPMKRSSIALLAIAVLFTVGVASGQDSKPPAATAGAQPACCVDTKSHMGQMDEHMKRMQGLHEKMASATTSEERRRLMDEQRQEMQRGMSMMQQMQHGDSMTSSAGMGMMGQKGKPADQKTQMQMMEKRMDVMQTMMQTMMDQQGAAAAGMMPPPTR
jgi:uncharacterized protein YjbJ (UPF0337 family)